MKVGNGLLPEDRGRAAPRCPYAIDGVPALSVPPSSWLRPEVDRSTPGGDGAWIDYGGPPGTWHVSSRARSTPTLPAGHLPRQDRRDRCDGAGLQDRHPTSWPPGEMAGPEIHANAISTLLRGAPLPRRRAGSWTPVASASRCCGAAQLRLRPLLALGLGPRAGGALHRHVTARLRAGPDPAGGVPLIGLGIGSSGRCSCTG